MKRYLFLIVLLFYSVGASAQTAMQSLASSMAAGSFAELTTNNINVFDDTGTDGNILSGWSSDAAWDPTGRRLYYIGNDHKDGGNPQKFVVYDDATNTWTLKTTPPWSTNTTDHGYFHHAIDVPNRIVYRRYGSGGNFFQRYSITSDTWLTPTSAHGDPGGSPCCSAIDWFPERNRLVHFVASNFPSQLYEWNPGTDTWALTGSGLHLADNTGGWGAYTPMNGGNFLFGSDSGNYTPPAFMYGMNSSGTITVKSAPPFAFVGVCTLCSFWPSFVPDPVTGEMIVLEPDTPGDNGGRGRLFSYNVTTDTWAQLTPTNKPNWDNNSMMSAAITNYGVIMFVACFDGIPDNCKVWLYKHQAAAPDTTAPTTPTSLTSTPVSPTRIDLTWIASTDNIAVAGYNIERCTGTGCSSFTQITATSGTGNNYSDLSAAPLTSYSYRVRARDAVNNFSGYSNTASATTPDTPPPNGDFELRCMAPGVIKCVDFDDVSDITGEWGLQPQGVINHPGGISPGYGFTVIDTTIKASGAGSMKMPIKGGQVGNFSGDFFANFSDDYSVQFGENTDFYIQHRIRMDDGYVYAARGDGTQPTGITGMKQGMVGAGSQGTTLQGAPNTTGGPFTSCTDLEIVWQNNNRLGVPQMYHNCGRFQGFTYPQGSSPWFPGSDERRQSTPVDPGCYWGAPGFDSTPPILTVNSRTAPDGNCQGYYANEWMTIQTHVHVGPLGLLSDGGGLSTYYTNSHVDQWISREGGPPIQTQDYNINLGPINPTSQKYGQIWLLPFSGSENFPLDATVWYDDLIISTQRIAEPTAVGPTVCVTKAPGAGTTITIPGIVVAAGESLIGFTGLSTAGGTTVTSVKYNTTETFTSIGTASNSSTIRADMRWLASPTTNTSADIVFVISSDVDAVGCYMKTTGKSGVQTAATGSGTGTPTVTNTNSTTGETVVGFVAMSDDIVGSVGSGETDLTPATNTNVGMNVAVGISSKAGASSVTMTRDNSDGWAMVTASFIPNTPPVTTGAIPIFGPRSQ